MAIKSTGEPDASRVVAKGVVVGACTDAIAKMVRNFCAGQEYSFEVPENMNATEVAEAVGGAVVREFGAVNARGIAVRVCIVRISVGVLTTSLAASPLAKAGSVIVEQCEIGGSTVQKVNANTTLSKPALTDLSDVATVTQAKTPIIGDAPLKAAKDFASKAAINFNVIADVLAIFNLIAKEQNFQENKQQDFSSEFNQAACCNAIRRAADKVVKKIPQACHDWSLVSFNKVKRIYARKEAR